MFEQPQPRSIDLFTFFFQFLTWTSSGKSINTTEKSALILVKLPSLKVMSKIFATLRSYILALLRRITFKFGNFTNFKALFSVVSMDFSELVHIKS